MLTKIYPVLLLAVGVFAQGVNVERRYQAAYKELDSNFAEKTTSRKSAESSESTFSSFDNSVAVQIPPSILVMPEKKDAGISELEIIQKNSYARLMMECISDYFSKKEYSLKSLEGQKDINEFISMQNDIAGNEDDLAYVASLFFGADIYLKFSGDFSRKNIRLELKAYESVTGALLGNEVYLGKIESSKSLNDNIKNAAEFASRQLDVKLQKYWNNERQKGVQYKIVMSLSSEFDEDFVEDLHAKLNITLARMFRKFSFNVMTSKTVDVTVFADPAIFPNSQGVYNALRKDLKATVGVKKNNITSKLILLNLSPSN